MIYSQEAIERIAKFIAAVREGEVFGISLRTYPKEIQAYTAVEIAKERRVELARILGIEKLELREKTFTDDGWLMECGSAVADGTLLRLEFYRAERKDAPEPCVERAEKKEVSA